MLSVAVTTVQTIVNADQGVTLSASVAQGVLAAGDTVGWAWTVDSTNFVLNQNTLLSSATADTLVSCLSYSILCSTFRIFFFPLTDI